MIGLRLRGLSSRPRSARLQPGALLAGLVMVLWGSAVPLLRAGKDEGRAPGESVSLLEVDRVLKPGGVAFLGGRYLYTSAEHKITTDSHQR